MTLTAKNYTDRKEQIKQRNNIEVVIGDYIPMTRGKGLCPFHDDHAPSLSIDHRRQVYRCFVCNIGGDVIDFVQRYEKVDFFQALAILENRGGMQTNVNTGTKLQPNNPKSGAPRF